MALLQVFVVADGSIGATRNGRRIPRNSNKNENVWVVIDRHSPKSKAVENVDILQYGNKLYSIKDWD
jgi:hypothetical protein